MRYPVDQIKETIARLGSQRKAAAELGIPRSTLGDLMRRIENATDDAIAGLFDGLDMVQTERTETPYVGVSHGHWDNYGSASENRSVLVLSDLHCPFEHPDTIPFLEELKSVVKPDRVVSHGDEVDMHQWNMHTHHPDLPNAKEEWARARESIHRIERLFPDMLICESNHGSLAMRQRVNQNMPFDVMASYGDALFAERDSQGNAYRPNGRGMGWQWHFSIDLRLCGKHPCHFVHSYGANVKNAAASMGCSLVQGHHHSLSEIHWVSSPVAQFFAMTVGSSIDEHALAFAYGKTSPKKPVIAHAAIIDGVPRIFPMFRDKRHNRWDGKIR